MCFLRVALLFVQKSSQGLFGENEDVVCFRHRMTFLRDMNNLLIPLCENIIFRVTRVRRFRKGKEMEKHKFYSTQPSRECFVCTPESDCESCVRNVALQIMQRTRVALFSADSLSLSLRSVHIRKPSMLIEISEIIANKATLNKILIKSYDAASIPT